MWNLFKASFASERVISVMQHLLGGAWEGKHDISQFFQSQYWRYCGSELLLNMWDSRWEETIFVLLLNKESKT